MDIVVLSLMIVRRNNLGQRYKVLKDTATVADKTVVEARTGHFPILEPHLGVAFVNPFSLVLP